MGFNDQHAAWSVGVCRDISSIFPLPVAQKCIGEKMSFLEDAQNFMKNKHSKEPTTTWNPIDPQERARLFDTCHYLYENATNQEIERAIERVLEELDTPYEQTVFMKKLRTYLED